MTVINLIAADVLQQRETSQRLRVWGIRWFACACVLIACYAAIVRMAAGPNAEVRQLSERVEELQVRFRGAEGLISERDRLDRRLTAIAAISHARSTAWYLETVGRALTRQSYLHHLTLERCLVENEERRGRQVSCESNLILRGYAPGHSAVGRVMRSLAGCQVFEDVTLSSVSELPGEEHQGDVRFHMECRLAER